MAAGGGGSPAEMPAAGAGGDTTGMAGSGGMAGDTGNPPGPTMGCGNTAPLAEAPLQYTQHDLTVDVAPEFQPEYTTREYHTRLPNNYDPDRQYPVYMWGNGCGVSQGNPEGIPSAGVEGFNDEVIGVFVVQEDGCFQAGKSGTMNTPDVPYMTAGLDDLESKYCVDTDKIFLGGYSSTGWFAATVSCSHGDRIRGIGMAAGGQQPDLMPCTGPTAAIMWVSSGDGGNPVDAPGDAAWAGPGVVRDRLIAENGCTGATAGWDAQWPACIVYEEGCPDNPVVFCDHGGGHDNGGHEERPARGGTPPATAFEAENHGFFSSSCTVSKRVAELRFPEQSLAVHVCSSW